MKYINKLALLATAALLAASCSQNLKTSGVSAKTNGLCYTGGFSDAKNGYCGGDNGWVMYTHDGGKTWTEGRNAGMALYTLDALDGETCIEAGTRGNVTKTVDGGKTWTRLADLPNVSAKSISFVNENIGWVAAKNWLGKTSDGGASWNAMLLPPGVVMLEAVSAISPESGLLLASNGILYRTDDAGKNWVEAVKLLDPKDPGFKPLFLSDNPGAAIRFSGDKGVLIVIGTVAKGRALRQYNSNDAGKTWKQAGTKKLSFCPISLYVDRSFLVSTFNIDTTITTFKISD